MRQFVIIRLFYSSLIVIYNVTQTEVQGSSGESSILADRLGDIHDELYAIHGHGAITRVAEEIGVPRERVSNMLNESAREIVTELERMVQEDD